MQQKRLAEEGENFRGILKVSWPRLNVWPLTLKAVITFLPRVQLAQIRGQVMHRNSF